jgi:hypothetical protein
VAPLRGDVYVTVKSVAFVAEPTGVTTRILPVVAPTGTVAVIFAADREDRRDAVELDRGRAGEATPVDRDERSDRTAGRREGLHLRHPAESHQAESRGWVMI